MNELSQAKGASRSHSMYPGRESKRAQDDAYSQSYLQNPLYIKNTTMWNQIIKTVSKKFG